jgi:OOP family OmpA-OmpF porin
MRGYMKPIAAFALATTTFCGLRGVSDAQESADAIINALKPSGDLVAGSARGIKLGGTSASQDQSTAPAASASPQSTVRSPAEAPARVASPFINLTVNFPTGTAELTPAARASLDALGHALSSSELSAFRFRIEGHTDNVGSREENRDLSQRRAEAVVSYLTSQYNVAPARLEAVGMGQENLLVETPPQTPEARNRRVQVVNLGG